VRVLCVLAGDLVARLGGERRRGGVLGAADVLPGVGVVLVQHLVAGGGGGECVRAGGRGAAAGRCGGGRRGPRPGPRRRLGGGGGADLDGVVADEGLGVLAADRVAAPVPRGQRVRGLGARRRGRLVGGRLGRGDRAVGRDGQVEVLEALAARAGRGGRRLLGL